MAKDILKEAIADAKAVREVALANAKAALEEAFTPKLQSMLSAKLSETLNEEEEELDETYTEDKEEVSEITGMDEDEDTMEENENLDEEIDLEEILNELELEEGEDSKEETVDEAKDEDLDEAKKDDKEDVKEADDKDLDEAKDDKEMEEAVGYPNHRADQIQKVKHDASDINLGLNEGEEFDLDSLLEEINNLDENEEEVEEGYATPTGNEPQGQRTRPGMGGSGYNPEEGVTEEGILAKIKQKAKDFDNWGAKIAADLGFNDARKSDFGNSARDLARSADIKSFEDWQAAALGLNDMLKTQKSPGQVDDSAADAMITSPRWKKYFMDNNPNVQGGVDETMFNEEPEIAEMYSELNEVKAALKVKTAELNEVNLLNSKLLYVNRIFKANNLDDAQKLRVVETLDKADCIKEAKLIYETIKDTFNVANTKKGSVKTKTKSLKENFGMASKAAGTSTAPKKEVIAESDNLVNRFQKLANIKINQ